MNSYSRVGKTFTALTIAIGTARQGKKVLFACLGQDSADAARRLGRAMADDFDQLPIELKVL